MEKGKHKMLKKKIMLFISLFPEVHGRLSGIKVFMECKKDGPVYFALFDACIEYNFWTFVIRFLQAYVKFP